MAIECIAKKDEFARLVGDTDFDKEQIAQLTTHKAVKLKITTVSDRSYQHHKLFFGGLLPFAYQYYDAGGGFVSESESAIVRGFAKRLSKMGGDEKVLLEAAEEYLASVSKRRSEKFGGSITRSMESFRDWLVVEAGYYNLEETPSGVRKTPKSISYKAMSSQEEFNAFYKACFGVVWNFVLSSKFENERQAEEAMLELMTMG